MNSHHKPENTKTRPDPATQSHSLPAALRSLARLRPSSTPDRQTPATPQPPPTPQAPNSLASVNRISKIARLPKMVRDQLNHRLLDGQPAAHLLKWLNDLPEVRAAMTASFDGAPITEMNLSNWRKGGFRDWLDRQEALEVAQGLAEDAAEFEPPNHPRLTDALALWLAGRYAIACRRLSEPGTTHAGMLLSELCRGILELRRSDQQAERIRIERERLQLQKQHDKGTTIQSVLTCLNLHQHHNPAKQSQITAPEHIAELKPRPTPTPNPELPAPPI